VRSKANLPVLLAYAVLGLSVLGYLALRMGGDFFLQPAYRVSAAFATASQLVPGDEVTISGLEVGRVESVGPDAAGGAEATLLVHTAYAPLYRDARATVESKNLLGETYVELSRGSAAAGPLPDGGRIDREHTLTPVEVDQVLNALDADTRDHLVLLIDSLGDATAGRGSDLNAEAGDLRQLADSLSTIAHTLASSQQHLDSLISSLRKVLETLAAWHSEFRALIADWDRLMQELASRERDLQGTLVGQDRVMTVLDQALAGPSAQDLHTALAEAPGALDSADHYLDRGGVVFPAISKESPSVAGLFYELASVMSATDSNGDHMWRVYEVGGPQAASAGCPPSNPYAAGCRP
jgi:virulence factor Mce-like protein